MERITTNEIRRLRAMRDDFDYGAEIDQDNYKEWPSTGKMTALIDADSLPYIVGSKTEEITYLKALRRGGDLTDTPEFKIACGFVDQMINSWIFRAKADSAKFYLTDGRNNFRIKVAVSRPYKGDRDGKEKPYFFYELKEYVHTKYNAQMANTCEADDEISIEVWDRLRASGDDDTAGSEWHKQIADCVVVSFDKDLKIIPGWHMDPSDTKLTWSTLLGELRPKWKERDIKAYEYWPTVGGMPMPQKNVDKLGMKIDRFSKGKNKGKAKTKRVQVGMKKSSFIDKLKGSGLKFFYAQLLMGDTTDCYTGVPGCGDTDAYNILDHLTTEEDLRDAVRLVYDKHYATSVDYITAGVKMRETGQLAWMQTYKGEMWR